MQSVLGGKYYGQERITLCHIFSFIPSGAFVIVILFVLASLVRVVALSTYMHRHNELMMLDKGTKKA
jgi:hypothetical protein